MMEVWAKIFVISLFYVILLTSAQDADKLEHGVVMSVFDPNNPNGESAQLAHIPVMPYYENISSSIKGLRFNNSKLTFLSVDNDYREKNLFLYDYHLRSIVIGRNYTEALDTDYMKFETIHVGVSKDTIQIAYDWLSRTLYWVDSGFRWVIAIPVSESKVSADIKRIIVDTDLEEPDGLTLDPISAYLFWADNGDHPKIERAAMDGSQRKTIITTGLNSPRSMEADLTTKRIYWVDSYAGTIESADYDGKNRIIVRRLSGTDLLDLAIYKDTLLVSNMYYGETYVLNKTDGKALLRSIRFKKEKIYGISIYNQDNQPMPKDFCKEKNCPHLCISESNGAKCVCADGYKFDAASDNCTEENGQFHRAIVMGTPDYICLLDYRTLSQSGYPHRCVYSVVPVPPTTPAPPTTTSATPPTTIPGGTTTTEAITPTLPSATVITPSTPKAQPEDQVKWMDVDMVKRVVYFSTGNSSIFSRPLDLPIENPTITKITDAAGTISGLVFDWVDGDNLYYSLLEGSIHVVNVLDKNTRRISKTTFTRPRNLALMPIKRRVAWIAGDTKSKYSVEGMGIDGVGHSTYRGSLSDPQDLLTDPDAQTFYIMDALGVIYRHPYNTGDKGITFRAPDKTPTILLKYKDYLGYVFTDPATANVSRWKTFTTTSTSYTTHFSGAFSSQYTVTALKMLDTTLLRKVHDPCAVSNGDCDQLCQMVYENGQNRKKCSCSLGWSLATDEKKCDTNDVIEDDFALVTDWTNDLIYQINLKTPSQVSAFKTEKSGTFVGVLYNRINKRVLWSELNDGNIYSGALDGSNFTKITSAGFYYMNRLALDEGTGNVYFTTRRTYFNFIGVVSPKSTSYVRLLDTPSFRLKLRDIVLHPKNGHMYYCAYDTSGGLLSYVGRADMDGKNEVQIQNGSSVYIPLGLAIDYIHSKLYWTDYYYDTVTQCDLDGKNCKVVVKQTGADMHDVDTDGIYIYLTAWNYNHLEKRLIGDFDSLTEMGTNPEIGKLEALSIYRSSSKNIQPQSEYCKPRGGLGRCSTMCLPKNGGAGCACLNGRKLLDDQRTCDGVPQCDAVIEKKTIVSGKAIYYKVTIAEDCLRYVGEKCVYSCPNGFEPVPKPAQQLECKPDGWDKQFDQLCQVKQCPLDLPNGKFDTTCTRMHGAKCSYTCKTGYKAIGDHVVCTNIDEWSIKEATLCTDKICSPAITNGAIVTSNCPLKSDTICQFTCNEGYKTETLKALKCGSDGNLYPDPTKLCQVMLCHQPIPNGVLGVCSKKIGVACDYTCNKKFTKPVGLEKVVCLRNGNWETRGLLACTDQCTVSQRLCVPDQQCIGNAQMCDGKKDCSDNSDEDDLQCRQCKKPIPNGSLKSSCTSKTHGDMCEYMCNTGYTNTRDKVTCTSTNEWDPATPCTAMLCPTTFNNGKVPADCDRKPNSMCDYGCNLGLDANKKVGKIQCLPTGQWNVSQQLCVERVVVNMGQSGEQTSSVSGTTTGLAVGLALAVLAIVAIIVFIVIMRRRSKGPDELPYARASFRSSGTGIAMENPGYMATNGSGAPQNGREMEQPYDNPINFSPIELHVDNDEGIVNPMYSAQTKEPLPEVSQVGMNSGDKDVLTADSWLKEQRKKEPGKHTDA